MGVLILFLLVGGVFACIVATSTHMDKEMEEGKQKAYQQNLRYQQTLSSVKVLGTRPAFETVGDTTVNYTVYSLFIIYKDGSQETKDVEQDLMWIFNPYIVT